MLLLGANGAGKTRLSVAIEEKLGDQARRIGAHRSLTMNTHVPSLSLASAMRRLNYGSEGENIKLHNRTGVRWNGEPATHLLSDFDALLQALYAEQATVSVRYVKAPTGTPPKPKLQRLGEIWQRLLPRRTLVIDHGSIRVNENAASSYDARELSDGERVTFYLLGHALLAPEGGVVIIDEPELHVNRAILSALWDAIESERRDCCFVYVTHDLEMAASRRGATRYAVESYDFAGKQWQIERVPEDIVLPEELVAKIVGSRMPILFVEGTLGGLDTLLYRHAYKGFTVHGAGACEEVIRTVQSFNRHNFLHRVGCAGLVDADDRDAEAVADLDSRNIRVLPVAEIENFMLLPEPFLALAKVGLHFSDEEAEHRLNKLKEKVFTRAKDNLEGTAIEATRRRVDGLLKRVELAKGSAQAMEESYKRQIELIEPAAMYTRRSSEIDEAIRTKNYERVLLLYANKGLFADAAAILGMHRNELEGLLGRLLGADVGAPLLAAVRAALPNEAIMLAAIVRS